MAVQLTKETEDRLKQKVASGPYASEDEVVRAGLNLLEESEALRMAIEEGERQLARGQVVTESESRTRIKKLLVGLQRNE